MSRYLLDTTVLAALLRKRTDPRLLTCLRSVSPRDVATSAICIAELRAAAAGHPRESAVWERIRGEVLSRVPVLPFGEAEAIRAGDLLAGLSDRPPTGALLVAATALEHGLFVATREPGRYDAFPGLSIVTWCG
jgi:predicted nucleic acid-binding protein